MNDEFKPFADMSHVKFAGRYSQLHEFIDKRHTELLNAADKRRSEIASIEEKEDYAKMMREKFIEKIGGISERDCPLNPMITKTIDMGNYIIEGIIFESAKGVYVSGTMYIPKDINGPSPSVLFLSGHTVEGRLSHDYQRVCQTLVDAGLVVFAIDPPGQGERKSFFDRETGQLIVNAATRDHDFCGIPSLTTGKFIESYFMRDQKAAIDYMLTRKEVDPQKIGVTGCSGGALQTLSIMACDDRIAAAAPSCFTTTRRDIMYTNQSQDADQWWPGCACYGFDHFEPYIIFAPKPALILAASADFFPVEGAYEVYDNVKKIYSLYGSENNLRIFEANTCHGYPQEHAEAAADFFCCVFGIQRKSGLNLRLLSIDQMQSTKSGNVLGDFADAQIIPDEVQKNAAKLRSARPNPNARSWLTEKVNYARIPSKPWVKIADSHNDRHVNGYTGKSMMWWVQKQLAAYGVLISAGNNDNALTCHTVIALWDNGTKEIPSHEEWIKEQCDMGRQVLVVDCPGSGDLEEVKLWGARPYRAPYGMMYKMCCDLMYMDDSIAAMNAYHLMRTVEMLRNDMCVDEVSFYCDGQDGVWGVIAGYLSDTPREYGENLLVSVEKTLLTSRPMSYDNTLSYIIPGMLEYFDYEDIM